MQPLRTYPELSESYAHDNKEHLDRMRFFLDDLITPFRDKIIEIHGVPIVIDYAFRQSPFGGGPPGDWRSYYISIQVSRLNKIYGGEFDMKDYDYLKGYAHRMIEDYEKMKQEEIKTAVVKMFWQFLDDYTNEKKGK